MIEKARQLLADGKLVAFPTETVYGLGADATNAEAVARIFSAKGRPPNNPLIVHVADVSIARRYAQTWPAKAQVLADAFWPGPLTIVLPKSPEIADAVSAGTGTVGLRVPDHPLALALLRAFDGPVAAPSANKSNYVSPTTADHVRKELGDAVDFILDGGPCTVGIESTVLDLTAERPRILRPGAISRERIEGVIGRLGFDAVAARHGAPLDSPGQLAVHYAPRTPCYRVDAADIASVLPRGVRIGILVTSGLPSALDSGVVIHLDDNPEAYARRLYAALRELDALGLEAIYVQMPPEEPRWVAVRDRLARATSPIP